MGRFRDECCETVTNSDTWRKHRDEKPPDRRLRASKYARPPVKSTVEALEGNKVKLSVEVEPAELDRAIDGAFKRIAHEVRIPGFRPGKAPRRILEARLGTDAARQEALREALPEWYAAAVVEHDVDVIAPPEIDITAGAEDGDVVFDAVVEVRPKINVGGYDSLRVPVPTPVVDDEAIDAQIERLRSQFGELRVVERPASDGDHVSIDIAGSVDGEPVEGLTADDYLYEVGSGSIVPEIDEHLRGAKVGDILVFDAEHPDPDEEDPIALRILVKEVKEKVLPALDDEWANEASEFETVDALRDDFRARIGAVKRVQAQLALRQGVIDELTKLVSDEPPEALITAEVDRRARDLVHRLSHQGASVEQYLEAIGKTPDELTAELREAAQSSVKADLALRAVIDAEGITADDAEVDAEVERLAQQVSEPVTKLRKELERGGQIEAVRSDVTRGKALEWLADHAEVVDEDGNVIDRALLEAPPLESEEATAEPEESTE
ncbi:MAG: trigger factor [Actinomycetota bacterium]|nr:trigger factor [Actinomycetota bacterium]